MSRVTKVLKRVRGDQQVILSAEQHAQQLRALERRLTRIEQALTQLEGAGSGPGTSTFGKRLDAIDKQLAKLVAGTGAGAPLRATIDRDSWAGAAQDGELDFHKGNTGFRANDAVWAAAVDADWRAAGFEPEGWEGKTVLDVGAGSRLRSLWFQGAELLVLEPLADRFRAEVTWNDLDRAAELYSVPGEEFVPQLEKRADLVVSINALDHGFDIAQSFRNIRRYLKDGGQAFLSFDMHDEPDYMHPLVLTDEMVQGMYAEAGLEVLRVEPARRYHGAEGPGSFHYWLAPVG